MLNMKKNLSIVFAAIMLISILSISSSAVGELHPVYTPTPGMDAVVDGKGANFDKTGTADAQIGTDFYIVDYQDSILTFQLTVQVPMYVTLAVVGKGEVAVPSTGAYGLTNFSGYPVNVTAVTVNDPVGGWKLVNTASPVTAKEISISLEGKNLVNLNAGTGTLTQIPKATTLTGSKIAYDITAKAAESNAAAQSGFQFSVSYTLALVTT